jgi:hypothetical protein
MTVSSTTPLGPTSWIWQRAPMAERRWHRELTLQADADVVLGLLRDPRRLPELHPLIDHVDIEATRRDGDVTVVPFSIVEHVPLGPWRVKNTYRGEVHDVPGHPERSRQFGFSRPAVTVDVSWDVRATSSTSCRAVQDVVITAPFWVAPFVFKTAGRAHDRLVAALRQRVESRA